MFRTDGNPGNTELVMDLDGIFNGVPSELTVYQNQIYFAANDESARQLWRTNGEVGDMNVSERLTSVENGTIGMFPTEIQVFNGELFWNGSDGTDLQVWQSDGVETEPITDFEANPDTLDSFQYRLFTEFDDKTVLPWSRN